MKFKVKKYFLSVIICIIITVFFCFLAVKLLYLYPVRYNSFMFDYSDYIKKIVPILCTIIVFITGSDALYRRDAFILKVTYLMICFAEFSFSLGRFVYGVLFFTVCQILLSVRHSAGIRKLIGQGITKSCFIVLINISLFISFVISCWTILFIYPVFKRAMIFYIVLIYGLILGISLWLAIANFFTDYYPRKNIRMIVNGMVLFFLSDLLVGIEIIIKGDYYKSIVDIFVWLLYTPAISLIALSNYRLKGR